MVLATPQSFSRPKYRPDVDGMRALAILSVLFFHAFPESLPGGFVGVDIFFVISGYLISSIIFRGLTLGSFSFFDFYARRVRRIFPAVTAVLLGSFLLGFYLLSPEELQDLVRESPYAAFFLENWRLYVTTGGYWETATELKPFMHFWSLGVEEQYYIFYPLICFLLWKVSAKRFLLSLLVMLTISLVLCLYDTYNDPVRAFYSLHSRFWELLIGGVLAYVELQWPQYKEKFGLVSKDSLISALGVALILLSIIFFEEGKDFPGWRAIFPTLGSVLIIAAGSEAWLNKYLFSNRIAVFIGLISYPLYLWHWPFISIFRNNLAGDTPQGWLAVILIACSFVMAYLTYALIERPMRSRKATWQMVVCLVVVLALVSLGFKTALRKSDALNQTYLYSGLDETVQEALKKPNRSERSDRQCTVLFGKGYSVCRTIGEAPRILIFGDSHAQLMWNYIGRDQTAPSLYLVASGGAVIFDQTAILDANGRERTDEKEQVARVWDVIRSHREIDTVILRGFWLSHYQSALRSVKYPQLTGDELYRQLWKDTFKELHALDKKVILVLDNIAVPFNPLIKFSAVERVSMLDKTKSDYRVAFDEMPKEEFHVRSFLRTEAGNWDNVQIVDSWDALCDQKGCYLLKDKIPYYRDDDHLSYYGNGKVWELIKKSIH